MLVVDVPLNTTLADLDEALRTLLKRELERHGFEGVDIGFDAPSREWSGKLTGPTVNVFLYDIRESQGQNGMDLAETRNGGTAIMTGPALRLEATYAITAWSKAVEDEHRLLSQVLSILFSHKSLPKDLLAGRLAAAGTIETVLGRPMEEKADFWTAVGGTYKPSLDYAVRLSLESGATFIRGPEVRTQSTRVRLSDGPRRTMVELHRFAGRVQDTEGEPVANAWVALPDLGIWTSSDAQGRYIFDRVQSGAYQVVVRTADGREGKSTVDVPSRDTDVVIGGGNGGRGKPKKR